MTLTSGPGLLGVRDCLGTEEAKGKKTKTLSRIRQSSRKGEDERRERQADPPPSIHLHHLTELKSLNSTDSLGKTLKTKSAPFLLNAVTKSKQATLNANLFILTSDVSLQNEKWSRCDLTLTGGWVLVHGNLRNSHIQW